MQNSCAPYTPRNPRLSDYYRCVEEYFEELERVHEDRYQARFGYLRPEIRLTIFRYLDCGCLQNGFARVRCDDCGHEYLVAFSCKRSHFCPPCHQKWVIENPTVSGLHLCHYHRWRPDTIAVPHFLTGCTTKAPGCAEQSTKDLLVKVAMENVSDLAAAFHYDFKSATIKNIRTSGTDKETGKVSCEGEVNDTILKGRFNPVFKKPGLNDMRGVQGIVYLTLRMELFRSDNIVPPSGKFPWCELLF